MPLKVEARVVPTDFVFQESPGCDFTLLNDGSSTIEIIPPAETEGLPRVRLADLRHGTQQTFEGDMGTVLPTYQPLKPGEKREWSISLDERCRLSAPGEYQLSLLYPFKVSPRDPIQWAESSPVRIVVQPSKPAHLALASVSGAMSPMQSGVWVNTATTPARLMRGTFRLMRGQPQLVQVKALAPAPADAEPELSTPANGTVSRDHWVAWLEGRALKAIHYGEASGVSPVRTLELPDGEPLLIGPLHTVAITDPKTAPAGSALLWIAGPGGSQLVDASLEASAVSVAKRVPIDGPRPVWARSFGRTAGDRLLVYLQANGERLTLHSLIWPAPEPAPRPLAEWNGRFVAAGAAIDAQDGILGALVVEAGVPGSSRRELRMIQWRLAASGGGKELRRDVLDWDPGRRIASAEVRATGKAIALLLRDESGAFFLSQGGGRLQALPDSLGGLRLPLEITFKSDFDPILIRGLSERGWEMLRPDGTRFVETEETPASER